MQRRQRDEGEIGEGDARHADGERELLRVLGEARRDQRDELVGVDERGDEQHDLRDEQQGEDAAGETIGGLVPLRDQHARIGRHIGRVERALAEDGAKLVGQPQRDDEGVGERADAHHRADHQIAGEAGQPRQGGEPADREEVAVHAGRESPEWAEAPASHPEAMRANNGFLAAPAALRLGRPPLAPRPASGKERRRSAAGGDEPGADPSYRGCRVSRCQSQKRRRPAKRRPTRRPRRPSTRASSAACRCSPPRGRRPPTASTRPRARRRSFRRSPRAPRGFAEAVDDALTLASDGTIRWLGDPIGKLIVGVGSLEPGATLLADEALPPEGREAAERRLSLWLAAHLHKVLAPLIALADAQGAPEAARSVALKVSQALGVLERERVKAEVKALDQEARGALRKLGVRFGAHYIYVPALLKPAARTLCAQLWALAQPGVDQDGAERLLHFAASGRTSFAVEPPASAELCRIAGFRLCGDRAVRVDIVERLSDLIRAALPRSPTPGPADEADGFVVTGQMTSLTGCSGEPFASILRSLGFVAHQVKKSAYLAAIARRAAPPPPPPPRAVAEVAVPPAAEGETAAAAEPIATEGAPRSKKRRSSTPPRPRPSPKSRFRPRRKAKRRPLRPSRRDRRRRPGRRSGGRRGRRVRRGTDGSGGRCRACRG